METATESHNWSKDKEHLIVGCPATMISLQQKSYTQITERLRRKGGKAVRELGQEVPARLSSKYDREAASMNCQ